MKKLIVAAAIVCVAAISQASTVSWGMSQVYTYGSDSSAPTSARADNYIAYLMVGDGSGMTALDGAGIDAIKAYVTANNTYGGSALTSAGAISVNTYGDYTAASEMDVYAVVFDANTIDAAAHFYVTAKGSLTVPDSGDGQVAFGKQKTGTTNTSNWYATAETIPEPTSGLLMLVGLGALALRRRRA